MEVLPTILGLIGIIFILAIGFISIWAILKFALNYRYRRDHPLATLPQDKTLFEIISPKYRDGIFNLGIKKSSKNNKNNES